MGKGRRENLTPVNELAKDLQRERRHNAALAAAASKRRKKTMREALEMLMFHTKLPDTTKSMLKAEGIDAEDMNHQMVITRSLIAKAESGDVQAYNAICAMIGEKPAEKVEMSGGLQKDIRITCVTKSPEDDSFPSSESDVDAER